MSDASKAVFLSYASQDSEAAKKICAALRAAGVEVWFDQSELRGGDSWDQKIRKQIKECALFVPIVSANTQARGEGYFRLEWKLAVDRSHLMARDQPFLVPVVLDATVGAAARVPDEFHTVQWTRIGSADSLDAFCERVEEMLSDPSSGGPSSRLRPAGYDEAEEARRAVASAKAAREAAKNVSPSPSAASRDLGSPPGRRKVRWIGAAIALAVVAFIAFRTAAPEPLNPELKTLNSELPAAGAADKSIAVLPFTNLSDDKENTLFFSDGMHEDILTSLANIRDLRVVSRTSVMEYRDTTKKIPQIARELGVAYILEGSVRRAGSTVRITGQLIRAANDEHLWAKSYDRELTPKEMFAIQAALATEIAGALHAAISPEAKKILERRPTENLAAYDLYLKARPLSITQRGGLRTRVEHLQQAVELDPNFAEAWGELAVSHAAYVFQDFDHTPARLAQADAAIGRALRLAPEAPEIIRLFGLYAYNGYRDYTRATEQFEKVLQLRPNDAESIFSFGTVLRQQSRWREAAEKMRRATELDPANLTYSRTLVQTLAAGRRWNDALAEIRRLAALQPDNLGRGFSVGEYSFLATGSLREVDDFFASLTPERLESRQVINWRKWRASTADDYAEWKRLDALQPYFAGELELPEWQSALNAATMLAAHGDRSAARARLAKFPDELRAALALEPGNARLWVALAQMEALLGQKEEALRDAARAVLALPESRDAQAGATIKWFQAMVWAWTGESDQAMAELHRLFAKPLVGGGAGIHRLRVEAGFAPLRDDPRFQALLNDPKNNEPLF